MPVEIVGADRGSEREAAEKLRQILESRLNGGSKLTIVVGARCFGYDIQDIDLLLLGTFGRGLTFTGTGTQTRGHSVKLVNLALIIEVKDHSELGKNLRFDSQHVKVHYANRGWEDVTDKAFRQAKTLAKYLDNKLKVTPWFESLVWLRNYTGEVPAACSNVLGAGFTAENFFAAIERVRKPTPDESGAGFYIAFGKNSKFSIIDHVVEFLCPKIEPTERDRRRLELICKRLIADQKYVERLGTQLLVYRGRGGSGKTIHLLRLARDLYDDGKRVLLLTYNNALVSDIRRLLVILDISSSSFDQSVRISTAHRFFISMMRAWGYWHDQPKNGDFDEHLYKSKKKELLELIAGESPESLKKGSSLFQDAPQVFGWDYVLVDEAQDWPEDERDFLFTTFGFERCVVADGVDQLTREQVPCDWTPPGGQRQVVHLRKALRMESSLCRFMNAFAKEAGVDWDQEVNDEIQGGEITIIDGPYTREWHEKILKQHTADGNQPVDALFCVPPAHRTQPQALADRLRGWGYCVWDGTDRNVRGTFPMKQDEHRIVQYASCRGLEGWTVVCVGFDKFYEGQFQHRLVTRGDSLESPEESARRFAGHWCLIPLTRAIHHLVIQLDGQAGTVCKICQNLGERYKDFVTWHRTVR